MVHVSLDEFSDLVNKAVAEIPAQFASHLNNVAFMVDEEPSQRQLRSGGVLHGRGIMLLGLYEGVPLPRRAGGYNGAVPDIITIFRAPHMRLARDTADLRSMVQHTVWHEVAHYFGLDHGAIRDLEKPGK